MSRIPLLVEFQATPTNLAAGMSPESFMPANAPPGIELDPSFAPIPLSPVGLGAAVNPTIVVRVLAGVTNVDRVAELPGVVGVFSDPRIAPLCRCHSGERGPVFVETTAGPCGDEDCSPHIASGTAQHVIDKLGVRTLWDQGYRGQGIVIGILDGGVDSSKYPVIDGWSPDPTSPPGVASHWGGHGNMCAFDALIAAPNAKIYDLGVGKDPSSSITGFVSSVATALRWSTDRYRIDQTPQVLSNSWGLYQQSWDPFPPNHPGNYTHNPNHPVNRLFIQAIDMGILCTFAAGNCGARCPDGRCGSDVGEGKSIRGSGGMERVICVGATNLAQRRIGYSSEGPGPVQLDPTERKPDLCGYSHFKGHFPVDNGTSAACPVVAGVLALLRCALSDLRQDDARAALNETAFNICAPGYDRQSGHGIVNPLGAYRLLTGQSPTIAPQFRAVHA